MANAPSGSGTRGALLAIFLIVFVDLLGFGLIIPLLPFYARTFKASDVQVTLLFSAYSICQFVAAPLLGMLSDRFGRRPILLLSQVGSVAGFVLLGYATSWRGENLTIGLALLYAARIIDGLSGGNISTAQAYISDVTTSEDRARGMGLLGAAFGLGFIFGPAIGGLLAHWFGQAVPAYAAAAFSALAAGMTFFYLPESSSRRPTQAETWLRPSAFLPVLKRPVLAQLMLIWFVAMTAFVMIDSTIVLYLNDVFGFGEAQAAGYFVFVGLIIALVQGSLIKPLTRLVSEWTLCVAGPFLVAAGYLVAMSTAWHALQIILVIGGAVYAIGRSIQQPAINSLVSKVSDPADQGLAFGLFQGAGTVARVTGPLIAGPLYTLHHVGPFLTAACVVAGAAVWTWTIRTARNNE